MVRSSDARCDPRCGSELDRDGLGRVRSMARVRCRSTDVTPVSCVIFAECDRAKRWENHVLDLDCEVQR
jgi:hypothetical protein